MRTLLIACGALALVLSSTSAQSQPPPIDAWTIVASLDTPVASSQNTVSAAGGVYVFGGTPAGCCSMAATDKVQRYDPATNTWSLKAPMPATRVATSVAALGGSIYVFGGEPGGLPRTVTSTVWRYDTASNAWTTGLAPMPTARTGAGAAVVNNKIYVIGGARFTPGATATDVVEAYDPATNTWQTGLPPAPRTLNEFGMGVLGTKILVIGGGVASVDEYDTVARRWTARASLPTPRRGLAAAVVNGHVFVVGGTAPDCGNPTMTLEYDPVADAWTTRAPLSLGRYGIMAASLNGAVYAIGGIDNPGCSAGWPTGRVERYDVAPLGMLTLAKPVLAGCLETTGRVTLAAPAPAGGLTVALHSDNPNATVPASVTVKAGATKKSFTIETNAVVATETTTIEASLPEGVASAVLTLEPMGVKSVTLTPNPVVGGATVAGLLTLPCPAGPGDVAVTLTSTKAFIAEPTTDTILIPVGTQDMPFEVRTTPVFAPVSLAIRATANEVTKSKKLEMAPVP